MVLSLETYWHLYPYSRTYSAVARRVWQRHRITSSAWKRRVGGMVRPRASAVFSRVEDWRGTTRPVSSPRHLIPGGPVSGTGLACSLRVRGDETYRLGALSGPHQVPHSVIAEQPERGMQPGRTPPLPAKTPTIPRPHHVPPDAPFDPHPHKGKAPARMHDPEVVHPAPSLGLIAAITRSTGCDREGRNTSLNSRSNAVRAYCCGVYCGRQRSRRLSSTIRLFSSFKALGRQRPARTAFRQVDRVA
jgi:hypothetical protein